MGTCGTRRGRTGLLVARWERAGIAAILLLSAALQGPRLDLQGIGAYAVSATR